MARFKLNPRVTDELGDDPWLQRFMLARGIDVRKTMRGNLPSGKTGGRRVAQFSKQGYAEIEGTGADLRVEAGSRWRLAHIIEYGGPYNPAYAPVRKAVAQLGLRFEEGA